ncbi:MAG TPA: LuxR C-terminal-related transcriptional regulator [Mycobacteriales bacterium]
MLIGRDEQLAELRAALGDPGLVVVAGPAGIGKTALAHATGLPLLATGALATLRHRPGLPLTRALRAPVPVDDVPLAAEAVRARLRDRVLLVDDVQWADPYTLAVLAAVAPVARVVVTLRMPAPVAERLRAAAAHWLDLPPLAPEAAAQLCADPAVLARAGGNPLALTVLPAAPDLAAAGSPLTYAAATLVAELPVPARTALAALGLLGRPVPAGLLGPGVADLVAGGLAAEGPDGIAVREPYVAEVAAGVLPAAERAAMHARLGAVLPDGIEAARHLIAAGSRKAAAARATLAAEAATTAGERATALLVAESADPALALPAAVACAAAGMPAEVLRLLTGLGGDGPAGRVSVATLRAGALVDLGRAAEADAELRAVSVDVTAVPAEVAAAHAVASVRAALGTDPEVACALAEFALADLGVGAPPALLAAHATALRAAGRDGWDAAARTAMEAAAAAGDRVAERLAGAALIAGLRNTLRVAEAGDLASELAAAAAADGAYSAELQFRAEALWAALHADGALDEVLRSAGALLDRTAPPDARALLLATLALAHADAGGLPTARALLGRAGPAARDRTVRWVWAEAAWLDGHAVAARDAADALPGRDLAAGLALLTGRWARQDTPADADEPPPRSGALGRIGVGPIALTVAAWDAGGAGLVDAAAVWDGKMVRERVRCLLGAGLAGSVESLLAAEQLAAEAGLAALLGRVRRALRAHGVSRRPTERAGGLSPREREVLALVGEGLSTRRIAELLGVTRHAAETYVKSAMATLGARTRTEAAVRAAALSTPVGA